MGIIDKLKSVFGRGEDDRRGDGEDGDAQKNDEDRAIEAVEADMVQSRDDAFTRITGMPRSGDDY
jgi:hypothetical protein